MCSDMKPPPDSRIDMGELKAQIVRRIGVEGAKRYFYYLNRLLSSKLSKTEFDKSCYRVIGRENLPLHNQFIRSILKNACNSKPPSRVHEPGPSKSLLHEGRTSSPVDHRHDPGGSVVPTQFLCPPNFSNGVMLPVSPRKGRSGIRGRMLWDRLSPVEPNRKLDSFTEQSEAVEDSGVKFVKENGDMDPCDQWRPSQQLPVSEQLECQRNISILQSANRQVIIKTIEEPASVHSKDRVRVSIVEDKELVEPPNCLNISRSILAPIGIPCCSASIGGARKSLPIASSGNIVYDSQGLTDTDTLKRHMEQIAVAQGLGGVSMDCANVLNNMLDVYLKRLIRSCVDLVKSRSQHEPRKQHVAQKQQIKPKLINGLRRMNHYHMQSSGGPPEALQDHGGCSPISLVDFKAALELNPQQLGEDWPLMLEKICMRGFDE